MRFLALTMFFLLTSCLVGQGSPIESSSNDANLIQSDDIIVSNTGNDSIILLDPDGVYKATLVDAQTSNQIVYNGLGYDAVSKQILYVNDHAVAIFESINALSLFDGSSRTVLNNNQLAGTMPGVARLTNGDYLVLETATTVEKFNASGIRQGAPFIGAAANAVVDMNPLLNGGFVLCASATAGTVRTYNAAGVIQATATSATPVPSLGAWAASSCAQTPEGNIVVAYSNAAGDAVRMYNSALTTTLWTYQDTNLLTTPGKVTVRSNGNVLVSDTGFHHIIELSPTGTFLRTIGGAVLSTPTHILAVP